MSKRKWYEGDKVAHDLRSYEAKIKYEVNRDYVYAYQPYSHEPDVIDVIMQYKHGEYWADFCDFPNDRTPWSFNKEFEDTDVYGQLSKIRIYNNRGK